MSSLFSCIFLFKYFRFILSEIFYEANGEYVVLFDKNNVNLTNPTRFDKFIVSGQTFSNTTDLIQALIDL